MDTERIAADRVRSGMKVMWRRQWIQVQSVKFGSRVTICLGANSNAITVDPTEEFEVLLTSAGGYDFQDRVPESGWTSSE